MNDGQQNFSLLEQKLLHGRFHEKGADWQNFATQGI